MTVPQERVEVLRTEDSMKEAVAIIAPQLGTDGAKLSEQLIDARRMTRLDIFEIMAMTHFIDHKNDYARRFADHYLNLKMSEEGHERSVLLVEALKAIGGASQEKKQKQDKRGWLGRNVTARNKGPDDEQ